MESSTRRQFIRTAGIGTVAMVASHNASCTTQPATQKYATWQRLNLGLASYSLRKFKLADALAITKRVGLPNISLKSMHMPLDSTPDQIRMIAEQVRNEGLNLYGAGVIYMKSEQDVKAAFSYAKEADLKVIVGVPNHSYLGLCDKMVKDFDIKLAIHNHGPGDNVYPTPESVYDRIKDLDPRIGLCIDVGHTKRMGLDPVVAVKSYAKRVHDIHIRDIDQANEEGKGVEVGRGIIDIPRFLKTLLKISYANVVSLEFEKDPDDPLAGIAESVGYIKGVLDVI